MTQKEDVGAAEDKVAVEEVQKFEQAFERLQKKMFSTFKDRINTEDEDRHLQGLILGERIEEEFELFNVKDKSLIVRLRSTNEEEESFANSISLMNKQQLSMSPEVTKPVYDDTRRFEFLLAMSVVAIGGTVYPPLDLAEARESVKKETKLPKETVEADGFVPASVQFVRDIEDRIREIKSRLPRGGMSMLSKAFRVWLKYQTSLLTGEKLENF